MDRREFIKKSAVATVGGLLITTPFGKMVAKNIEEKVGVQLTPQFMYSVGKANVKPEIVHSMIENFSSKGEMSMEPVAQYLSNELSEERNAEIAGVIKESIAQMSPSLTPDEINQEIVDMKRAHNS